MHVKILTYAGPCDVQENIWQWSFPSDPKWGAQPHIAPYTSSNLGGGERAEEWEGRKEEGGGMEESGSERWIVPEIGQTSNASQCLCLEVIHQLSQAIKVGEI